MNWIQSICMVIGAIVMIFVAIICLVLLFLFLRTLFDAIVFEIRDKRGN